MSSLSVLERILSCPNLPTLPSVALEVLELTRDQNVSVDKIAKAVEKDPALSAKVLKTVNSSLFGLQTPCTTIRRALGYLGLNAVKSIVLGFSLVDSTRGIKGGNAFDMGKHWRRSIFAAVGARAIAQTVRSCDPDEAFTAGLFQDLGVLALYTAIKSEYNEALAQMPADHARHPGEEHKRFGITHAEAGAALAAKWRLPDRYVQTIKHHHYPDRADVASLPLVRTVAFGTLAALTLTEPAPQDALVRLMIKGREWFDLSDDQMQSLMKKIADAAGEVGRLFEKSIGKQPDVEAIMAQAGEELLQQQIAQERESEGLRRQNETLALQTVTDSLTGCGNRKRFDAESERMFKDSCEIGRPLAVLMCDGDRFKSVNDRYGHPVGDVVLRELAARITRAVKDRGIVCRYGGEEFAILVAGVSLAQAINVAEQVRQEIEATPFDLSTAENAPDTLPVTISVGVASTDPCTGKTWAAFSLLLDAADKALYAAKHAGRNRVCSEAAQTGLPWAVFPVPTPAESGAPAQDNLPEMLSSACKPGAAARASIGSAVAGATRILLIEDDALAAKLLVTLLQKNAGVEVEWVTNGATAIRRFDEAAANPTARPHVILCDIMLPQHDGMALLKAARAKAALKSTPFVVLSSRSDATSMSLFLGAGATAFISKADLTADLVRWINRVVGEWASAGRAAA